MGNQIVEHHGRIILDPILVHIQTRRPGRVILGGHVNPIRVFRAGEYFASAERKLLDGAFGNAVLRLGVGPRLIIVGGAGLAKQHYDAHGKNGTRAVWRTRPCWAPAQRNEVAELIHR